MARKHNPYSSIQVGPYTVGDDSTLLLVAGPCVIESRDHCVRLAGQIKKVADDTGVAFVFKASFDKANRSSLHSFRGPGLQKGLAILREVKEDVGVPVCSDVHSVEQVEQAAGVLDIVQIPAFLARQTDLLAQAGQQASCVNIKKAQFMAPWDMSAAVEKVRAGGCTNILLTERGSFFGYNRWVADMRAMAWMQQIGCPTLMDATHASADPGGMGDRSGGQRQMGLVLARSGIAAGADGLFLEVHDKPSAAKSDAATVLPVKWLSPLLQQCRTIFDTVRAHPRHELQSTDPYAPKVKRT